MSLNPRLLARGSGLPRLNSKVKIPLRTFCRPLWVDEGDKVRTIYDGSWGGANAHIQRHTEECTTAPTVMDCVHCLHWLRASCDLSFQTGRCLARTGHGMAHTQTCQDPLSGLAISSGPNWCGMVGQQSGHLRHGKRPTLLGANGSPPQFSPKSTGASSL